MKERAILFSAPMVRAILDAALERRPCPLEEMKRDGLRAL